MEVLARELRRSLIARASALERQVSDLRGRIPSTDEAVHAMLELVGAFPDAVTNALEVQFESTTDVGARVTLAESLIARTVKTAKFVDDWLLGSIEFRQHVSLHRSIERQCAELDIGPRFAIVAPGRPDNFTTFARNPYAALFRTLGRLAPDHVPDPPSRNFALVRVPRYEGTAPLWLPMVLGHELAHIAVDYHQSIRSVSDPTPGEWDEASQLEVPPWIRRPLATTALTVLDVIDNWITEVLCDAHAVRRFGPAGAVAIGEFLATVGATDKYTATHPPGFLRTELMLRWLPELPDTRLSAVVEPWRSVESTVDQGEAASFLVEYLRAREEEIVEAVGAWTVDYDVAGSIERIHGVADLYASGIPGTEVITTESDSALVSQADVVNAAWISRIEAAHDGIPVERFAQKNLDTLEFTELWIEAGGQLTDLQATIEAEEDTSGDLPGPATAADASSAALSAAEIAERLLRKDSSRIVATPLVGDVIDGATLDLRLGNQFIVLQRSIAASFSPLNPTSDPRLMQMATEKSWGEVIVLHPGELVLASTLEYIVLPNDLTAQVITRSSYGRLGLITATAIQVQPSFHGCLTLELVNVGQVPLEIVPGERIAQLTFYRTKKSSTLT